MDLVATATSADLESHRRIPKPANENKKRKADATRIETIYEELGQRLTAISLALSAIGAGAEVADCVSLIRMAVAEAWQELKLHRRDDR